MIRGGGWFHDVQVVRSACRLWYLPGDRLHDLGFRCMSSVSQVDEQVSASKSEPRDEAAEKRRAQ